MTKREIQEIRLIARPFRGWFMNVPCETRIKAIRPIFGAGRDLRPGLKVADVSNTQAPRFSGSEMRIKTERSACYGATRIGNERSADLPSSMGDFRKGLERGPSASLLSPMRDCE